MIPVGTPCYVVRCGGIYSELNGRVVTVVGHDVSNRRPGVIVNLFEPPLLVAELGQYTHRSADEYLLPITPGSDASGDRADRDLRVTA